MPPLPASTNSGPTIGPVQEKDTMASVSAIKKMPPKLPTPALESVLLVHDEGSVISKAPRNEMPKMMKIIKKKRFAIQLVDSEFNALAPKMADINTPSIVKIRMMERE